MIRNFFSETSWSHLVVCSIIEGVYMLQGSLFIFPFSFLPYMQKLKRQNLQTEPLRARKTLSLIYMAHCDILLLRVCNHGIAKANPI